MKNTNVENNLKIWDNVDTWINDGEEWSEHFGDTDTLWKDHIEPRIGINLCCGKNTLEIACGRGRMTRKLLENKIKLNILDVSPTCIDRCKERFGDKIENYYVGNGTDLSAIENNSMEFIFSFDSFVHMHKDVINGYLGEIERVLTLNGEAWIHHSILSGGNENNFQNIAGRSNMSLIEFAHLAKNHGLKVVEQDKIRWNAPGNPEWLHDGMTKVKKTIMKL